MVSDALGGVYILTLILANANTFSELESEAFSILWEAIRRSLKKNSTENCKF
jgi:hypothetical protein